MTSTDEKFVRTYARLMLRSTFVSLFGNGLQQRRKQIPSFGLSALARLAGKDKSTLSRDFAGTPNWRLDTVSDLAQALNMELRIEAIDKTNGAIVSATGRASTSSHFDLPKGVTPVSSVGTITKMVGSMST